MGVGVPGVSKGEEEDNFDGMYGGVVNRQKRIAPKKKSGGGNEENEGNENSHILVRFYFPLTDFMYVYAVVMIMMVRVVKYVHVR
jgi:hypothetical protein